MEQYPIKEIKTILKNQKEINKQLSKLNDEDIDRLFGVGAEIVKECKERFLYSEEVLKNIIEHINGKRPKFTEEQKIWIFDTVKDWYFGYMESNFSDPFTCAVDKLINNLCEIKGKSEKENE
jgi:hypothetical protein